jgi:hypothetical protein
MVRTLFGVVCRGFHRILAQASFRMSSFSLALGLISARKTFAIEHRLSSVEGAIEFLRQVSQRLQETVRVQREEHEVLVGRVDSMSGRLEEAEGRITRLETAAVLRDAMWDVVSLSVGFQAGKMICNLALPKRQTLAHSVAAATVRVAVSCAALVAARRSLASLGLHSGSDLGTYVEHAKKLATLQPYPASYQTPEPTRGPRLRQTPDPGSVVEEQWTPE